MLKDIKKESASQVLLIAAISGACVVQDAMLYVALPVHMQEAGLSSLLEVGFLLSLNRLVRLPVNPLAGWVYSKISAKKCVVGACLAAVCIAACSALAHTFFAWILLRAAWGIVWAFLKMGSLFTVMGVSDDTNRGCLMGLYTGTYRIGSLLGMLGGGIIADFFGLKYACLCGMALSGCAAILAMTRLRPTLPMQNERKQASSSSRFPLLFSHDFLKIVLSCMVVSLIVEGFLASTLSAYLHSTAGETISLFGLSIGCAAAAGAVQSLRWAWNPFLSPLIGRISDRSKNRNIIFAVSCFFSAALFAASALSLPLPLLAAVLIGIELGSTSLTTLSDALAADLASCSQTVFVITAYTFVVDLGAALGPFGGFAVVSMIGIENSYAAAGIILALLGTLWIAKSAGGSIMKRI